LFIFRAFIEKTCLGIGSAKELLIRVDGFDQFDILEVRHPNNKTTTETNV
jgi:hypothetical protein